METIPTSITPSPKKGGRPKKADKCTEQLAVMCTLIDRKKIEERARAVGVSVSEFLRNLALHSKIVSRPKALPKEVLVYQGELNHLGSNLNQLSKKNNSLFGLDEGERQVAMHLFEKINAVIDDIKSYLK